MCFVCVCVCVCDCLCGVVVLFCVGLLVCFFFLIDVYLVMILQNYCCVDMPIEKQNLRLPDTNVFILSLKMLPSLMPKKCVKMTLIRVLFRPLMHLTWCTVIVCIPS